MTLVMIIMICVGCALILGGLGVLGHRAYRLAKAARNTGLNSRDDIQLVIRRGQNLGSKFNEMQTKQKIVAERLESLSATTERLSYLKDQLDQATGHLSKLKS